LKCGCVGHFTPVQSEFEVQINLVQYLKFEGILIDCYVVYENYLKQIIFDFKLVYIGF